jgi:hypothetical protein
MKACIHGVGPLICKYINYITEHFTSNETLWKSWSGWRKYVDPDIYLNADQDPGSQTNPDPELGLNFVTKSYNFI